MPKSRRQLSPSGHVYRVERKRGPVWYAKYRLPSGRQVQRRIGPAWVGRGRPPAGHFTKWTADAWLRDVLEQARRGTLPGSVETGATFADAAAEFMRYARDDRRLKPSTLRGYRSIIDSRLLPAFGAQRLEDITRRDVEAWRASLEPIRSSRALANSSRNRIVTLMHGILVRACRVWMLPVNPAAGIERLAPPLRTSIDVLSPEEVWALARAAASEQDSALYLTAAFTGLRRGELLALRWRDVDFARSVIRVSASYAGGQVTAPKSGKARAVPLAPDVAGALARLSQRELWADADDLVFPGVEGGYLDGSALRRRYLAAIASAGLRTLRFHDLRHTFGTRTIAKADIRRVQEWMGHADVQTTMRYLHYASREDDALLISAAFSVETSAPESTASTEGEAPVRGASFVAADKAP